jgi:hypothetical protein
MVQSALSTNPIWTGDLAGLARVSYLHFGGLHIPCYHSSNVNNVAVSPERGDTSGSSDIGILLVGWRDLYTYDGRVSSGCREWSARSSVRSTLDANLLVPCPSDVVRKGHVDRVAWSWPCYVKRKNI